MKPLHTPRQTLVFGRRAIIATLKWNRERSPLYKDEVISLIDVGLITMFNLRQHLEQDKYELIHTRGFYLAVLTTRINMLQALAQEYKLKRR